MDIRAIVTEIQNSKVKDKEAHFKEVYPEFIAKYPMIFKMACTSRVDMANLDFMLGMLEKMNSGTTQYDASAEVGQMLFDKYVDPKLDKTRPKAHVQDCT